MSLVSVVVAINGEVEIGVVAEDPGGVVLDVIPFSAGWLAGIRPGQRVAGLTPATDVGGWAIETTNGSLLHRVSASSANAALRVTAAAGVLAVLLALLAVQEAQRRPRRAELSAAFAVVLSAAPFVVHNQPGISNIAIAAAGVAPAAWLTRWQARSRVVRAAMLGSALVVSVAWGLLRMQPAPELRSLGDAWILAVAIGTLAMLLLGTGVTRAWLLQTVAELRLLDVAVAVLAVFLALGTYALGAPPVWAAAIGAFPGIVYARSRQAIREGVVRLLLAELRERAAIQATEAERVRMAREIHDDPLQAIAGVIQKLADPVPDTESARESLRDVAARLRAVATELHPPILDDLGLVPAIEALARGASEQLPIEVHITDETGYADRPPAEVELASYRIVQEAVSNGVKHANASRISIEGRVSGTAVELIVSDDGIGFSAADAEEALLQGHLGVSSMRQRAAAIGARVVLGKATAGGTAVTMRWPA